MRIFVGVHWSNHLARSHDEDETRRSGSFRDGNASNSKRRSAPSCLWCSPAKVVHDAITNMDEATAQFFTVDPLSTMLYLASTGSTRCVLGEPS